MKVRETYDHIEWGTNGKAKKTLDAVESQFHIRGDDHDIVC